MAINEFKKQFRSKTATPWEQRTGKTTPKKGTDFDLLACSCLLTGILIRQIYVDRSPIMSTPIILLSDLSLSIERSFEDEDKESKDEEMLEGSTKKEKEPEKIPDSTLAPELQVKFMNLLLSAHTPDQTFRLFAKLSSRPSVYTATTKSLCSDTVVSSLMSAALSSMNYDANKLPLGKSTIVPFS